ncbi:MAG: hypothetical protein M3O36_05080 [Myxococcota bacterium]|nr:hypothetical protein [Myxococcota bacterium]
MSAGPAPPDWQSGVPAVALFAAQSHAPAKVDDVQSLGGASLKMHAN